MTSPTKSVLSAAHKVAAEGAQTFIAGCRAMMEDYNSGNITEAQVVKGLTKWSEDAYQKKLEQALGKMINPEPISIDPAMFRASLKRKAEEISDSPIKLNKHKNDTLLPAEGVKTAPSPSLTNVSDALHTWSKAILEDMKTQIPTYAVKVFYLNMSDIAALTYGMETLFIYPEMCHGLRYIIEEKVNDGACSSARASLRLIQELLGLGEFKLVKGDAETIPGRPSFAMWEAESSALKSKFGNKKTDQLKKFAAHLAYLKGKPFWQICEASQSDIERLASQMNDRSLEDWLHVGKVDRYDRDSR